MQRRKNSPLQSSLRFCKRAFRKRNIIIISEHKVDHVPLSGIVQILLLVGLLGLFSGISYITGSYVTARNSLREKERTIVSTTQEKIRIDEEMSLLKHDLSRLSENGRDLSSYGQLLDAGRKNALAAGAINAASSFFSQDSSLLGRISSLENRIKEIQDENEHLILAIRLRTGKKISDFEDIISMTGLDSEKLERLAAASAVNPTANAALTAHTPLARTNPRTAQPTQSGNSNGRNEGGPFIPYDSTLLNEPDRELLADIDQLMLLHGIIDRLPLSRPIHGAQTTGPFGKRIDPLNGSWAIHPGVDLAGPAGSKIYATSPGIVVTAAHHAAYGNMVDVAHGLGIVTRYAHMNKIIVKEGEQVRKGQQLGVQGSTGRSTGQHLHYEVRINDRPVNPVKFLNAGEYVSQSQ